MEVGAQWGRVVLCATSPPCHSYIGSRLHFPSVILFHPASALLGTSSLGFTGSCSPLACHVLAVNAINILVVVFVPCVQLSALGDAERVFITPANTLYGTGPRGVSAVVAQRIVRQAAVALKDLHSMAGSIHLDLKVNNLLVRAVEAGIVGALRGVGGGRSWGWRNGVIFLCSQHPQSAHRSARGCTTPLHCSWGCCHMVRRVLLASR